MKFDMKSFICGIMITTVGITTVFAASGIKSATYNSNQVVFNGRILDLSGVPMVSIVKDKETNASNYMPVRAVLEQMGYIVDWNANTNSVIISDKVEADVKNNDNENNIEMQVVTLVNEQRQLAGLAPLSYSQEVSDIAYIKAKDMADNNYFAHNSPTHGSVADMFEKRKINYRALGENIAQGHTTPELVVDAWMNSSGHKANILSAAYTEIGIGVYKDSKGIITWVQMFLKRP